MNLKKLIEERNKIAKKMEEMMLKVDGEARALSEEEEKQFDELNEKFESLNKTIEKAKKLKFNFEKRAEGGEAENGDEKEARAEQERKDESVFRNMIYDLCGIPVESEARASFTRTDNGAVIPTTIANKIIVEATEISPIFNSATKYNINGNLTVPKFDETDNQLTMTYADEFAELTESAAKFASITLTGYLSGCLSKISKSLINNSKFDIVNFIIARMGVAVAKFIEKEMLYGTTNKIEGLSKISAVMTVTTATANAITSDELIDVQDTVKDAYQRDAYWIMNRKTRNYIRKLKDGQGNYLLNRDYNSKWGYTLLGKDVYTSDAMKSIANDTITVFYGDFSGIACKISEELSLQVLMEKYATQHAVGIVGWAEMDAKIEDAQKIACLKQKKS